MILAPVSRGRAGGGDEGGGRSGGLRHHPSRLLLLHSPCAHRPLCAPAARSMPFDPAAVLIFRLWCVWSANCVCLTGVQDKVDDGRAGAASWWAFVL